MLPEVPGAGELLFAAGVLLTGGAGGGEVGKAGAVTNYSAGAKFEYKVRDALKAQGAIYVCRSAGSHGPVDLIAFYPPTVYLPNVTYGCDVRFVQCKRHGAISKADRWALTELAQQCGAIPVLAKAGPRGTPVVFEVLGRGGSQEQAA